MTDVHLLEHATCWHNETVISPSANNFNGVRPRSGKVLTLRHGLDTATSEHADTTSGASCAQIGISKEVIEHKLLAAIRITQIDRLWLLQTKPSLDSIAHARTECQSEQKLVPQALQSER